MVSGFGSSFLPDLVTETTRWVIRHSLNVDVTTITIFADFQCILTTTHFNIRMFMVIFKYLFSSLYILFYFLFPPSSLFLPQIKTWSELGSFTPMVIRISKEKNTQQKSTTMFSIQKIKRDIFRVKLWQGIRPTGEKHVYGLLFILQCIQFLDYFIIIIIIWIIKIWNLLYVNYH